MANQTFIKVDLTGVSNLATAETVNYINSQLNPLYLAPPVNVGEVYSSYNKQVPIPQNAVTLDILTDGAYFFPAGEIRHTEKTLQRYDEIKSINVVENQTIAVYSYFEQIVIIRVSYE